MSEVKPCDEECPKCGSADVMRAFYANGQRIETANYNERPSPASYGDGWLWTASRDHLSNFCRCCKYKWASKPMKKQRAKRVAEQDLIRAVAERGLWHFLRLHPKAVEALKQGGV